MTNSRFEIFTVRVKARAGLLL